MTHLTTLKLANTPTSPDRGIVVEQLINEQELDITMINAIMEERELDQEQATLFYEKLVNEMKLIDPEANDAREAFELIHGVKK